MDTAQAQLFVDGLMGKTIGGWKIEGFYGNGKSAVVMKGSKDNQTAAIKVFHPELVERYGKQVQLKRIDRETSLVGADHPNLVKIYGGGECEATGHLFVAMEALPYKNLKERLVDIPLEAVPRIISQVASAARFLEDRGLAHRDIKPENIAISDDFNRAVLLDLGVLLPTGTTGLTDVDQRPFIGTLQYSSPEFLLRIEENTKEDWRAITFYQLGAVLHDLLTKTPIFHDYCEPFSRLVDAVQNVYPVVASENTRLANLAKKCLLKNPKTRLELVAWSDFSEPAAETTNVLTLREQVKERQKLALALKPKPQPNPSEAERIVAQTLKDLCNRLESRIASLMSDAGCFPLRSTRSCLEPQEHRFTTVVHYAKDANLGLPFHLVVCIRIHLIDINKDGTAIFRAESSAALTNESDIPATLPATSKFFAGEAKDLLDSSTLEEQFMDALSRYYLFVDQGNELEGVLVDLGIHTQAEG